MVDTLKIFLLPTMTKYNAAFVALGDMPGSPLATEIQVSRQHRPDYRLTPAGNRTSVGAPN